MSARSILILFAHPAFERSHVNRRLAAAVRELDGVTFHDLYQAYPDFDIDVEREQALLAEHETIVMQHPFYWYSTPALLKEWQDLVLQYGWAYGRAGTALHGKTLLSVTTAGASESAYCTEGLNCHTVRQFLAPIEHTGLLCGMRCLPPFVVYGTHALSDAAIDGHAADYARLVGALRDGTIDRDAAAPRSHINADLDAVIRTPSGA